MYVFRPARLDELRVIYDMQNIPFRDVVYANYLPPYPIFEQVTLYSMQKGREQYYIFDVDGRPDGFVQYVKYAKEWNIIVWGKWLNTLIYLGLKTAYDDLGCPKVTSAIRQNNRRVCKAYEKFRIRKTGQEMVCYQKGNHLGYIATANLIYYEMNREEFEERRDWLCKNSLEVTIMPPGPAPFPEAVPAPETSHVPASA